MSPTSSSGRSDVGHPIVPWPRRRLGPARPSGAAPPPPGRGARSRDYPIVLSRADSQPGAERLGWEAEGLSLLPDTDRTRVLAAVPTWLRHGGLIAAAWALLLLGDTLVPTAR
jgi:hypothetical protein